MRRRQRSQIGCPSTVLPATGLSTPHRLHTLVLCRCAHGWHIPPTSVRVNGRPVTPQPTARRRPQDSSSHNGEQLGPPTGPRSVVRPTASVGVSGQRGGQAPQPSMWSATTSTAAATCSIGSDRSTCAPLRSSPLSAVWPPALPGPCGAGQDPRNGTQQSRQQSRSWGVRDDPGPQWTGRRRAGCLRDPARRAPRRAPLDCPSGRPRRVRRPFDGAPVAP